MPAVQQPIVGINPGQTAVYELVAVPVGAVLPFGVTPVWTSSNTAEATVVAATGGLTGTVTGVTDGSSIITVSAVLPNGTTVTGTTTQTIGPLLTSFGLQQIQ